MNASLRLRRLTSDDLAFGDAVRAREGWNQTRADWERLLAAGPDGCFLAEWQGVPAGTATTTVYGPQLAWVGMVLVHPEFRRRGIGRALLEHCLEHLRRRGVRCVKLDATSEGRKVYATLGFQEEWTLTRWERSRLPDGDRSEGARTGVGSCSAADLAEIIEFDAGIFGVSRPVMLEPLARAGPALFARDQMGRLGAYGMLRPGARAAYLGPMAGSSAELCQRVAAALLRAGEVNGPLTFWDIPDRNVAAVACAVRHGFRPQRTLTRMFLGQNAAPGIPENIWALAAPEVG